jgi:hypothetical protein
LGGFWDFLGGGGGERGTVGEPLSSPKGSEDERERDFTAADIVVVQVRLAPSLLIFGPSSADPSNHTDPDLGLYVCYFLVYMFHI